MLALHGWHMLTITGGAGNTLVDFMAAHKASDTSAEVCKHGHLTAKLGSKSGISCKQTIDPVDLIGMTPCQSAAALLQTCSMVSDAAGSFSAASPMLLTQPQQQTDSVPTADLSDSSTTHSTDSAWPYAWANAAEYVELSEAAQTSPEQVLGEGGCGKVFQLHHPQLGSIAVKQPLMPEGSTCWLAATAETADNEWKACEYVKRQLGSHPNLVQYLGPVTRNGQVDGSLAFELVSGGNLHDAIW